MTNPPPLLAASTHIHTHTQTRARTHAHPATTHCQSSHNGCHTRGLSCVCVLIGLRCRCQGNKLSFYLSVSLFLPYFFFLPLSRSLTFVSSLPMGKSNERKSLPSAFATGPLPSIIFPSSKDTLGLNAIWVVTACLFVCVCVCVCLAHLVCRGNF